MLSKALKKKLGLALAVAALAGCSTTGTTNSDADAQAAAQAAAATAAAESAAAESAALNAQAEAAAKLDRVFYFEFDSSIINAASRATLIAQAEQLKASGASVRLEGHADERGTREYNMALGERRANAVRDFLTLQGVSRSMMESISYGEEYPAVVGSNDASYAQNRRVELK